MSLELFNQYVIADYWKPLLEKLYQDGKVQVKDVAEANAIKDIVSSCTHDDVSIEYMNEALYVIFNQQIGGSN